MSQKKLFYKHFLDLFIAIINNKVILYILYYENQQVIFTTYDHVVKRVKYIRKI